MKVQQKYIFYVCVDSHVNDFFDTALSVYHLSKSFPVAFIKLCYISII